MIAQEHRYVRQYEFSSSLSRYRIELVVRNHPDGRRVTVRNVLEPVGHEPHAIVEYEDAGRVGQLACQVSVTLDPWTSL